jgi:hypothetical protein
MNFDTGLATRAVGQFPISIATSLALEGAFGIHPDLPPVSTPPILKYSELWINVRTLFRNLMGSLDKDTHNSAIPSRLAEEILLEMDTIDAIVSEYSKSRTKVVYYFSNYNGIETKYKHAVPRLDNTDAQKTYTALQNSCMEYVLKESQLSSRVKGFDLKIKGDPGTLALILTSYAFDLIASKSFARLSLLESHTGKIKEKAQFYTKYYNGKDLANIPFREDLLTIFGDSSHFRPMALKLREEIIAVATKYSWTHVTTLDKIKYSINEIKNPYAKDLIRDILLSS